MANCDNECERPAKEMFIPEAADNCICVNVNGSGGGGGTGDGITTITGADNGIAVVYPSDGAAVIGVSRVVNSPMLTASTTTGSAALTYRVATASGAVDNIIVDLGSYVTGYVANQIPEVPVKSISGADDYMSVTDSDGSGNIVIGAERVIGVSLNSSNTQLTFRRINSSGDEAGTVIDLQQIIKLSTDKARQATLYKIGSELLVSWNGTTFTFYGGTVDIELPFSVMTGVSIAGFSTPFVEGGYLVLNLQNVSQPAINVNTDLAEIYSTPGLYTFGRMQTTNGVQGAFIRGFGTYPLPVDASE